MLTGGMHILYLVNVNKEHLRCSSLLVKDDVSAEWFTRTKKVVNEPGKGLVAASLLGKYLIALKLEGTCMSLEKKTMSSIPDQAISFFLYEWLMLCILYL